MRLDRLLANLKYGTRKEVHQLIKNGDVFINGKPVFNTSLKVNPEIHEIMLFDEILYYKDEIILALNKPLGYLSANSDSLHPVVTDLLKEPYHRFDFKIAGRLDLDAEGLLILTTSGRTAHEITNPSQKIPKTYLVTTNKNIEVDLLKKLLDPISILDGKNNTYLAQALSVEMISDNCAKIVINTGRFHQVKRMFKEIGYEVINLKRIQIAKYVLPNIKPGEYLEIRKEDIL